MSGFINDPIPAARHNTTTDFHIAISDATHNGIYSTITHAISD